MYFKSYSQKEDSPYEGSTISRKFNEMDRTQLPSLNKTLTTGDLPRNCTVLRHVKNSTVTSTHMIEARVNVETTEIGSISIQQTLEALAHVRLQWTFSLSQHTSKYGCSTHEDMTIWDMWYKGVQEVPKRSHLVVLKSA